MSQSFDVLIYIGRFQPFHQGHSAMLQVALSRAAKVIVVLGSAGGPRTTKNPFTAEERQKIICESVLALDASRVKDLQFIAIRDYNDGQRWVQAVQAAVSKLVLPGASIGLFGHFKDSSSLYLKDFPAWPLVHQSNFGALNASDIRRHWWQDQGSTEAFNALIPAAVKKWMRSFKATPDFKVLMDEFAFLEHYREVWAAAPYPPVFVTVDAVVQCGDYVLMIQRGGQPGRGCWALPGGFLDQHERVADAAIRELAEETCVDLPWQALVDARQDSALFDHPDRSLRGRTLTHAFYFKLALPLPKITAADDAAAARWVPVRQILGMESQIFEDHLLILDHFLHLFKD